MSPQAASVFRPLANSPRVVKAGRDHLHFRLATMLMDRTAGRRTGGRSAVPCLQHPSALFIAFPEAHALRAARRGWPEADDGGVVPAARNHRA
ncbi:hypothetical protein EGJ58_00465 [Brucella anthropi]|nr:hypothetical protein EGJ58_00465 [Brucella anthropi]